MSKLVAALITVPLLGFVFFYFFTYFHKSNIEHEIATQRFERDWAEVRKNSPFTTDPTDKQKYEQRAAEAEQKIKELEEKKKEKEKKLEKLTDDFEQALHEALKDERR